MHELQKNDLANFQTRNVIFLRIYKRFYVLSSILAQFVSFNFFQKNSFFNRERKVHSFRVQQNVIQFHTQNVIILRINFNFFKKLVLNKYLTFFIAIWGRRTAKIHMKLAVKEIFNKYQNGTEMRISLLSDSTFILPKIFEFFFLTYSLTYFFI